MTRDAPVRRFVCMVALLTGLDAGKILHLCSVVHGNKLCRIVQGFPDWNAVVAIEAAALKDVRSVVELSPNQCALVLLDTHNGGILYQVTFPASRRETIDYFLEPCDVAYAGVDFSNAEHEL